MRPPVLLNLVLLAALLIGSAWWWPSLPDLVPVHFALDGTPDRWGDRSAWWWMPGCALGLTALFAALDRWAVTRPGLINIPGKARLLALPPAGQRRVMARVADLLWLTNALALVLFGLIQWSMYHTAVAGPSRGLSVTVVLVAVLMGPIILLGLPWVEAELARQQRAAEQEQASATTGAPSR